MKLPSDADRDLSTSQPLKDWLQKNKKSDNRAAVAAQWCGVVFALFLPIVILLTAATDLFGVNTPGRVEESRAFSNQTSRLLVSYQAANAVHNHWVDTSYSMAKQVQKGDPVAVRYWPPLPDYTVLVIYPGRFDPIWWQLFLFVIFDLVLLPKVIVGSVLPRLRPKQEEQKGL